MISHTRRGWIAGSLVLLCALLSGCDAPPGTEHSAQNAPQQASVMPPQPADLAPLASVPPTYKDLAYANLSNAQKLDLYIPTTGTGPFPVVVMIHGGGFMFGDKADGAGLAGTDQLLAAGYAVASINYRLSSEATFPAQIYDAKAAVRFLRANAKTYALDAQHIAAWGASAGGTLAALLGTSCGVSSLEGADLGNADQSSCVQAVVDWFGPIDFLSINSQFAGSGCPQTHDAANSFESKLMGGPIQSIKDFVSTSNAMQYISANDPPFFIENGSADCNVPPAQSKNFAAALSAVLGPNRVTYVSLPGAGHGGPQFSSPGNIQLVLDFLQRYLHNQP